MDNCRDNKTHGSCVSWYIGSFTIIFFDQLILVFAFLKLRKPGIMYSECKKVYNVYAYIYHVKSVFLTAYGMPRGYLYV